MIAVDKFSIYILTVLLVFLVPHGIDAAQLSEYESNTIIKVSSHNQTSANNGIVAEGIFFENTAIMEFINNSDTPVKSFTFWLGAEYSFESFKTELGWTGNKTPEGVIIFTATKQLDIGESVKFGVKTNEPSSGINWRAADKNGNQIGIGRSAEATTEPDPIEPIVEQDPIMDGVFESSTFRIVPEKPKVGSTIRVAGEGFGVSQQFSFYIDTKKIGVFNSDENGNFIATMKIPNEQEADRVNFMVIDGNGNEKTVSLRLGAIDNRVPTNDDIKLTISEVASVLHRGDILEVSGTALPGSAITATVKDPVGNVINIRIAEVDSKGEWKVPEPITIPLDAIFGKYSAEITDGRDTILRTWEVESAKMINIESAKTIFEPGETMRYDGTASPNKSIEFILEDPFGNEVFSQIVNTDSTGYVTFEYETHHSSNEGTYTLIATQDRYKEFIFTGLGQAPIIPINLKFDKLNYKPNETAIVSMSGNALEDITLLIIDQADHPKDEITITLGPDGVGVYLLDLAGYRTGVYTAVISKGNSQNTEIFTVGLSIGVGTIESKPTKVDYNPGDPILILGKTDPNSLLVISLTDPDGNEIRSKETFSDKDGRISDDTFRIPNVAKSGAWTISTKSGPHFDTSIINVINKQEGMIIIVEERDDITGSPNGDYITIKVIGASTSQTVTVDIIPPIGGEPIDKLKVNTTNDGDVEIPWQVPKNAERGIYTIVAKNAGNTAQTTYELK